MTKDASDILKNRYLATPERKISYLEEKLSDLTAKLEAAERENSAIRALMNSYNIGGWTDAIEPMKRAETAEAALAEKEKELQQAHRDYFDFILRAIRII